MNLPGFDEDSSFVIGTVTIGTFKNINMIREKMAVASSRCKNVESDGAWRLICSK